MDDIAACLAPDGWLLVLEDQRMNVGELPHDKGFLVLDGVELQELFGVSDREPDALRFTTVDDRLSLAQISRAVLRNCDGSRVQGRAAPARQALARSRPPAPPREPRSRRPPPRPRAFLLRNAPHQRHAGAGTRLNGSSAMPPTRTRSKLSPALWEAVKTEILQILRDHARRRQTLSYSELVAKLTTVEIFHRSPLLKKMLCEISREEARADRGMLSVVVVQKGARGLPGDRFFELAEELGRAVTHREAAYEAEKELVFAANAAARRP